MAPIRYILNYLKYYFTAQTRHDVHSPFVYDFVTNVICNKKNSSAFNEIEKTRNSLLNNPRRIQVTDFGSAWGGPKNYTRKISAIAKNSSKSKKYARLLYRIAEYIKPETILELGTSFGISTLYLASANPDASIITIEGCAEIAKIAADNFQKMNLENIRLISDNFDSALNEVLKKLGKVDLVFFDGNHQKDPTLKYFNMCMEKAHSKSIFIFDDINWSDEMKEAWKEIKSNSSVTVTIDLFIFGIVFLNPELTKQNFVIRF